MRKIVELGQRDPNKEENWIWAWGGLQIHLERQFENGKGNQLRTYILIQNS